MMFDIYGTLGPACADRETLSAMFSHGMTGMRLNLSHITLENAADTIMIFYEAARDAHVMPKLLIDMQGPEVRIGDIEEMELLEGDSVSLGGDIPVPDYVIAGLREHDEVLLDDGKILLEAQSISEGSARMRVVRGGLLSSKKSLAVVGRDIPSPTLTATDIENLKNAMRFGVTGVMQPFVRDRHDLEVLRQTMEECGCGDLEIFAKIENMRGVEHLREFFDIADHIVIARGDLGNAMPLWELPGVQKHISRVCREAGVPFMVVTQMLESMTHCAVPTRAEVSDIYNAVLDGAGSIMVTGETAVGKYPVEVIKYLTNTAREALNNR
ncbi:MAG: pyruvate kinase [Lachnospiraceae bacterium]|nr:pyruvate kinase [Lachnospiraceae bacterium]